MSRLWRYNLHYFDDLNAIGADERGALHRSLVSRWVDENPPFAGVGWEPYPSSIRIVNWIKWALSGVEMEPAWLKNLALQVAWLDKHVEWHLLGNHLFANAKALVFAGLFFEGRDAEHWLRGGLEILEREIPEQILDDGGQFELSPMYHAIATEDVLDLLNVARTWPGEIEMGVIQYWQETARKMLEWSGIMRHPDGRIALFNDSAFGIASELDEIFAYAERLCVRFEPQPGILKHLEESGYVRATLEEAVLFADIGRIGPDYLPGHAHADTLGFELSIYGDRWFVDSGCSTYETCDERLRQRSTQAHNTVTVDGENSSEIWNSFRVARRARPMNIRVDREDEGILIVAAHDGFKRLPGHVTHNRSFRLSYGSLKISDRLDGAFESAQANYILHPRVEVSLDDGQVVMRCADATVRLIVDGGVIKIRSSSWHPEFGTSVQTSRVTVDFAECILNTTIAWSRTKVV